MFDLTKAIDEWCEKVIAYSIWDADKVDELKDHLHCIIEEDIQSGTSPENAFKNATNAMGYPASKIEDSSGRVRIVQTVCRLLNKIEGSPSDSPLIIMHSIIWAAIMIALSILTNDSENNQSVLFILIAGWFASFVSLGGTKRSAKQEWRCLKRRLTRLIN